MNSDKTSGATAAYWSDVVCDEGDEKLITYRTGMVVYEESLTKGRFMTRGWNGSGFISYMGGRLEPDAARNEAAILQSQAFRLEIDGQSLSEDWEWVSFELLADDQPIPAMPRPFQLHAIVELRHSVRPITVRIHTGLDGTAVLVRWVEVINSGTQPAALASAASWSGVMQVTQNWRAHLPADATLYSLGYFASTDCLREGDFQWVDLPQNGYHVDGRYNRHRHRHPFFVLRNNATGEHFTGQLAWSGGYRFEFDLDGWWGDLPAYLTFAAGPDAAAPQRVIAPGETIATPEMHLGLTFGDLDTAINAMHEHVRRSVIMAQPRGRGGWVESAICPEWPEYTVERINHTIDASVEFGAEVFFIDAGWYSKTVSEWNVALGDWHNDAAFADGLKQFRDRVHAYGMLWGLWMDPERLGIASEVRQQHPEWMAQGYRRPDSYCDVIDLTNPAAAKWMEEQIIRVIEENQLDLFRMDYNVLGPVHTRSRHGDYMENNCWRYYEVLYAIFDRLRARFPEVIFENCAGGGGRTDLGMVRRFSHTWVTDWQIAPRSFAITNGMTMALPPEYVDRFLGGQTGYRTADFDFQSRLLLFVRPTIAAPHPLNYDWNPLVLARLRHMVDLYKNFIRPFQAESRIFHHTPVVKNYEPQGWGVLELASADGTKCICGLFQLSSPGAPDYMLRLRGLDVGRRYLVTFDNSGRTCEVEGVTLMQQGLTIRIEGALTSELMVVEAI